MNHQGLDSFLTLYKAVKSICPVLRLITLTGASYTIFVPTDLAFDAISDQLTNLTSDGICRLLLGHIVNGTLKSSHLLNGVRVDSLAGTRLFVTTLRHYINIDKERGVCVYLSFL